jgi:pseudouridylate synthase
MSVSKTYTTAAHGGIPLVISDEVAHALASREAVVALESNVITHGLPYPDNVTTAQKVEAAVRAGGAVPATVGVDNGQMLIGMSEADIERFGSASGIPKVSSRDLPVILAQGKPGATTVASSLVVAELAGIPFFASAGIGGVHRGAHTTMDISSDLIQFTRSKVAVVSAGAKHILDLKLTMEYLETQCVPLISYRSDDFPAFYCASSGIRSPHRIDDAQLVARAIENHWAIGNHSAVLITTPPKPEDAVDGEQAESAVRDALRAAEEAGVTGSAVTKYLMRAIDEVTGGRTSQANMAVLISTAETGGHLAAAHAAHRREHDFG